jgi:hypothetical protein
LDEGDRVSAGVGLGNILARNQGGGGVTGRVRI